jgi:hypothetical protein
VVVAALVNSFLADFFCMNKGPSVNKLRMVMGRAVAVALVSGLAASAVATPPAPGEIVRVNVLPNGTQGNSTSYLPSMDSSGTRIAFQTYSTNLVPGDVNGFQSDVLFASLDSAGLTLASRSTAGAQGTSGSTPGQISGNGRYIVFDSTATNLVAGDTNNSADVFRYDTQTGVLELVSRSVGGGATNGGSFAASISADGRFIAFESTASNLVGGDSNGRTDIFVRDMVSGSMTIASVSTNGFGGDNSSYHAQMSRNGRFVTFDSLATTLVTDDINNLRDVFVRDLQAGTTKLISRAPDGFVAFDSSFGPARMSSDGRYIVYLSFANDIAPPDTNFSGDIFLYDQQTGTNERVNWTYDGLLSNFGSFGPSITDDGRFVVWESDANNMVPGDTNAKYDIFLRDRLLGLTKRLSISLEGDQGNGTSQHSSITPDGKFVVFDSFASNLISGDTNGVYDVFITQVRCPADIDGDGEVAFGDFLAFFNGFDTADLSADINGDSNVDFGDFLGFFNALDTGC